MNISSVTGFLLINKPIGISSFGCIKYLKRILNQKIKIGHAGTLDPFASGLLIVAVSREATRLIDRIMVMKKTYVATGKLGEITDTLDHTGTIVATQDQKVISQEQIEKALISFGSSYEQVPPLYSALKHEGVPLYTLVRHNLMTEEKLQELVIKKRRVVQLYDLQLLSYEYPYFTIKACVSHGTYIRTLINDIALRVGSCATTYQLVREAIGPFNLSQATDLSAFKTIDDINQAIILDPSGLFSDFG